MSTIRDHGTARWPRRRRWIRDVVAPLTTSLGAVVRAVHLRHVLLILALLILTYVTVIHPWMLERGSIPTERQLVLPGDGLRPGEPVQYTQAVTIEAPPGAIWPWLMQVGQDKAASTPTAAWRTSLASTSTAPTRSIPSGRSCRSATAGGWLRGTTSGGSERAPAGPPGHRATTPDSGSVEG